MKSILCPLITVLLPSSHFLVLCKGTVPPDKYALLSETNLCPNDAANVMVKSRHSVYALFILKHNRSVSPAQTPLCLIQVSVMMARTSVAGEDHHCGIPATQGSAARWPHSPLLKRLQQFRSSFLFHPTFPTPTQHHFCLESREITEVGPCWMLLVLTAVATGP